MGLFSVALVALVALVRLVYGSPEGLPSIDRLRGTFEGLGVTVSDLADRD